MSAEPKARIVVLVVGAWTPRVCKIMAFAAAFSGFGPLFYILWGSRRVPCSFGCLARKERIMRELCCTLAPLCMDDASIVRGRLEDTSVYLC